MVPRLDPRLIQPGQAQLAVNCKLTSGNIVPLKGGLYITKPNKSSIKTIYRMVNGALEYWLSWPRDVDVARGQVAGDVLQRTYYTGDGEPRMTTLAEAISGGANDYPKNFFVLGVFKPKTAPTVVPSGGVGAATSRAYLHTYVTQYGEESEPSPPSAVTTGKVDDTWALSAMDVAPPNSGTISAATHSAGVVTLTVNSTFGLRAGEEVTHASVVGMTDLNGTFAITEVTSPAQYKVALTTAQTYTSGGTWARVAPHNTAGMLKYIYRSVSGAYYYVDQVDVATTTYNDTKTDAVVTGQGTLKTVGWEQPPTDLKALIELPNGIMAGISKNIVCLCEPYYPYAWPVAYQHAMAYNGVALGAFGQNIVAATIGDPYLLAGNHPSTMSEAKVEGDYPCLAKRGTKGFSGGALYPTHAGMVITGQGGSRLVTNDLYTRDEWKALNASSFVSAVYQDRYYAGYTTSEGVSKIWTFHPGEVAQVIESNIKITALYNDYLSGELYFSDGANIYKWDSNDSVKLLTDWYSKEFLFNQPQNMTAAKIDAAFITSESEALALQAAKDAVITANQVLMGNASYSRSGATVSGSAVVTGLSKTSDLFVWMNVSGTGIPSGAKIKTIDSGSQITLTANATATGTTTLAFTGDIFMVDGAVNEAPYNSLAYNASVIKEIPEIFYGYLQFTLYADNKVKFSKQVLSDKAFSMPDGYKSGNLAVRLAGNVTVRGVVFGSSMKALREA